MMLNSQQSEDKLERKIHYLLTLQMWDVSQFDQYDTSSRQNLNLVWVGYHVVSSRDYLSNILELLKILHKLHYLVKVIDLSLVYRSSLIQINVEIILSQLLLQHHSFLGLTEKEELVDVRSWKLVNTNQSFQSVTDLYELWSEEMWKAQELIVFDLRLFNLSFSIVFVYQ